ncbi:oxygenase MpaB family protein [Rhodococcus qingshengii]|uniref:oxygenase MpaB family protein n=1 Tax=Rhodococcus qingshengii TaxID=334542 RepID=UPI001C24CF04|nr:oxygenase MpaB family protein [Rhodococcus qingshengii]QXC46861.1 DUF2236 domain-containing protein [Rhodococcus qingshengii]
MVKSYWRNRNAELDPDADYVEIYRNLVTYEFPWDFDQSLSLALFRSYAVPSIGNLLDRTGEFGARCQKRRDDTVLLMEAPILQGFSEGSGRDAIRRINRMHGAYDISNNDMLYTLATFVVVPQRWLDQYGWRRLEEGETRASVNFYREFGRLMGIREIPETFEDFAQWMDTYEGENYGYDPGGRRVADTTLALLRSYYPSQLAGPVDAFSRALMDDHLLEALRLEKPGSLVCRLSQGGLRVRARLLAFAPPRKKPKLARDSSRFRSYPFGYEILRLGTFPGGCPAGKSKTDGGC